MAAGYEWMTALTGAIAAAPVVVVLGTAAVLGVGGIIGCTKCVLGAMRSRREASAVATEPAGSQLAR